MKIRTNFVSNSSSSSFIINKDNLAEKQIKEIKRHLDIAYKYLPKDRQYLHNLELYNAWIITEDEEHIYGKTDIDNFDMAKFLKALKVKDENIIWEGAEKDRQKRKNKDFYR